MVRAVMKTAVGMLVRAREPAKCRSHNWCLSFGFRAVPLPLLPAALAQRMGSPKRDDAGHSQALLASKLLGWGTVTPHMAPQVGRLWGVLAAPLSRGDRGPALWAEVAADSVRSRVPVGMYASSALWQARASFPSLHFGEGPGPAGMDGSL